MIVIGQQRYPMTMNNLLFTRLGAQYAILTFHTIMEGFTLTQMLFFKGRACRNRVQEPGFNVAE